MLKTNLSLIFWLFCNAPIREAQAQIVPDQTLERESSIVAPVDELNDEIKGGATRGSNLFHSFTEFNVGEGRGVDFVNPASIDNIITRVTGNNISNIFGRLGVVGNANLFLINPNGIIFGEGARLDISGSFYGSTAESILFPDNIEFSATNPQAPILTINVPIGLGLGNNPGTIINRSVVQNGTGEVVGLEMTPAANLTLVGGEIKFEGGQVTAPGGRVELGGLSAAGIVTLKENGSLSFPQDVERADITLTNAAEIDVRAEGGGSITMNARNLELSAGELGSSFLRAGIAQNSESPAAKAGEIRLNVTDTISVSQKSGIINRVEKKGVGNAGEINVTTANLSLTQGSQIDARTYGQGDAGKITIRTSGTISANGESVDGQSSGIFNRVERAGVGNAGGITIATANLSLTQGGQFDASTYGKGTGGTINIDATDTILVEGRRPSDRVRSRIVTTIGNSDTALGEGGDINITTANLSLAKGGRINAGTYGRGNAGSINIIATDTIFVEGEYDNLSSTGILSEVGNQGVGDAEGITITTANLLLTRGGVVSVNTIGQGNAGTVKIKAFDTISIQDTIMIEERNRQRFNSSRISSTVGNSNIEARKGGAIEITTNNLSLTKGGRVNASTNGRGEAGNITIKANDTISVQGESQNRRSGIFSQVGTRGVGNGGGIEITTDNLFVTERGRINASTNGQGNGGTITVTANQLTAQNEGELSVRGQEKFNPGNITVNADKITLDTQSIIIADAEFGSQGNITLNTENLLTLRRESIISTNAKGSATGGNITINTNDGFIIALPQENSDITANAFSGSGGTININAVGIFGISELSREKLIELQETKNPDELDPSEVASSDITALSQVNSSLNGQINLNTLDIEPSRQLFLLPTQPLNSQIAQTCTPGTKEARSEFVLTGRGSIAPHSLEALQINPPTPDWVEFSSQSAKSSSPQLPISNYSPPTKIVEAQGWVRDENGEVILVANAANVTPHDSWQNSQQCAHK